MRAFIYQATKTSHVSLSPENDIKSMLCFYFTYFYAAKKLWRPLYKVITVMLHSVITCSRFYIYILFQCRQLVVFTL